MQKNETRMSLTSHFKEFLPGLLFMPGVLFFIKTLRLFDKIIFQYNKKKSRYY